MGPLVSPLPHKYIQKQKKLFNALKKYAWQALLDMGLDLYANWLKWIICRFLEPFPNGNPISTFPPYYGFHTLTKFLTDPM